MNDQLPDKLRYYRYLSQTLVIILGLVTILSILLSIMLVHYSMRLENLIHDAFWSDIYPNRTVLSSL